MSPQRVPVFATISQAWIDAVRSIQAMPVVALVGLLLDALIAVGVFLVVETIYMNDGRTVSQWMASPAGFTLGVLSTSIQIVLLAPLAIAVHRFVIRGDAAARYPLNPLRPSYLRYVGTALALNLAYRATDLVNLVLPEAGIWHNALNLAVVIVTLALIIAIVIATLRKVALFPAIAVHAPNATWREFPPAGAGNVWRILVVLACVVIPGMIGAVLLHMFLPVPKWPNGTGQLVLSFAMVSLQLPVLCALAAAVARIYLAIGTSDGRGPASAAGQPAIA